jgi:hypothetical protein
VLGGHSLRAPQCRDLQIAGLACLEGLVRGDLVPETFGHSPEVLHGLIIRLELFLLLEQRERLLPQELQIQRRTVDLVLLVLAADPVLRVEEVADEARRVLTVPVERLAPIEEPLRPIPDDRAATTA